MEERISIQEILNILRKRFRLILLITLVAVLISALVSYFIMTPKYDASTQILVNQNDKENKIDVSTLQSNVGLINTYSVIIKSPAILEKVIKKLALKQSADALNPNIIITNQTNSQVFTVTVEDSHPDMAVKIVNSVSETFQQEIKKIMNVDNVSILSKAELKKNPIPVKPHLSLNILLALVVGIMVGIGLAFLLEFLDNTLKDDQDITGYLKLPVLGSIPEIQQSRKDLKKTAIVKKMGSETIVS